MIRDQYPYLSIGKKRAAQFSKWFSNFREYFFHKIEENARQGLEQGVRKASDELIMELKHHFDKTNLLKELPLEFVEIVNFAISLYQDALNQGKDSDPAWKKLIYKEIAAKDKPIPSSIKERFDREESP